MSGYCEKQEFLTAVSETIKGLGPWSREFHQQTHYREGLSRRNDKTKQKCPLCTENHPISRYSQFKVMNTKSWWKTAKKHKLCYRCLSSNHRGNNCKQLGIDWCTETCNHLLHDKNEKKEDKNQEDKKESDNWKNDQGNGAVAADGIGHNEHCNTMKLERVSVMVLRTVPAKLKNWNKELIVNALLDDASTTTYINYDVAAELGLQGPLETVSISTMNGNMKTIKQWQ